MDYSDNTSRASTPDSLFDDISDPVFHDAVSGPSQTRSTDGDVDLEAFPAHREAPPIPGLYFEPDVRLPVELAKETMDECLETYFKNSNVNQVMLFGRAKRGDQVETSNCGLPKFLQSLLDDLEGFLKPMLPQKTHRLLFPPPDEAVHARQAIINLYHPGEGISPHVDLLRRFGDGIIGVSLGSGCVMNFCHVPGDGDASSSLDAPSACPGPDIRDKRWDLYLPERSVLVLSEDARYRWTHGIERRTKDLVKSEDARGRQWIDRSLRISITFRWLLPGADIVGGEDI
ncbi:hypothetical protein DENSPDRAFT_811858 [Dentipellis sp. KUC8613]|nr:hypothetical protein DENSPDRAFT_811858 [Dentipellis sp. KUC8613]